jgi:ankyrin repeat protein
MTTAEKPAPGELLEAVQALNIERAEFLLSQGADPDEKDKEESTCLMYAVRSASKKLVEMLLEKGADIDATNFYGITALMYATESDIDILRLLIEKGASLEERSPVFGTALDWAQDKGSEESVAMMKDAPDLQMAAIAIREKAIECHNTAVARQTALKSLRPKVTLLP